jgi:predicted metal-dependent hydrolase
MAQVMKLGEMPIDVVLKDIKNVHLSVHPPTGRVRIAAPRRMKMDTIRVFAISKLSWIKKQQKKLREQDREPAREFLDRESLYLWGKRLLLTVKERERSPAIEAGHSRLVMFVRPGTSGEQRLEIAERWYRDQVRDAVPALIAKWEPRLGVTVGGFHVRRMKTKWGSCNPVRKSILLNTELAKKPKECLEYIVVHELVHLLEPTHNARFVAVMDRVLPGWQRTREVLNRLPVRHEEWDY